MGLLDRLRGKKKENSQKEDEESMNFMFQVTRQVKVMLDNGMDESAIISALEIGSQGNCPPEAARNYIKLAKMMTIVK